MLRRSHPFFALAAATLAGTAIPACYGTNFSVSPRAWQRISEKNAEEGFTNDARVLRLAIDSGGCHGYLYKFAFENASSIEAEEDIVVTQSQVAALDDGDNANSSATESATPATAPPTVVVDKISVSKLDSAVLDYHSELKGAAFVVVGNALVDQSCACALSFSLKKGPKKSQAAGKPSTPSAKPADEGVPAGASSVPTSHTTQATPITRRKRA